MGEEGLLLHHATTGHRPHAAPHASQLPRSAKPAPRRHLGHRPRLPPQPAPAPSQEQPSAQLHRRRISICSICPICIQQRYVGEQACAATFLAGAPHDSAALSRCRAAEVRAVALARSKANEAVNAFAEWEEREARRRPQLSPPANGASRGGWCARTKCIAHSTSTPVAMHAAGSVGSCACCFGRGGHGVCMRSGT